MKDVRDMAGYGAHPPHPKWPNKARVAVQFVINYEEGAENCILNGDDASERFLSEIVGAEAIQGMRHANMESLYEYGSRAGFWRLHRMFTERQLPVTVFGVAMALAKNPEVVEAMLKADWEIASHGYRWIDYQHVPIELEHAHLEKAIEIHRSVTGSLPTGFYLGRSSPNTAKIIAKNGSFVYHSDSYADDLPYRDKIHNYDQLVVPYTLDTNDMRFTTPQGFNSGHQFFHYLKDSFDFLYEEGVTQPKMLSIGLHCRIVGRPGRAMALARFLDYIQSKDKVWFTRRIDIANHWIENVPCENSIKHSLC